MKIGILIVLVVVLALYGLNRGIFIGSSEVRGDYYYLDCRYLFPSGVLKQRLGGWNTEEDLRANTYCVMFYR